MAKLLDEVSELLISSPYERIPSLLSIASTVTSCSRVRLYLKYGDKLKCVASIPRTNEALITNIDVPIFPYVRTAIETGRPILIHSSEITPEDAVSSLLAQKWFAIVALKFGNKDAVLSIDDDKLPEPDDATFYVLLETLKKLFNSMFANADSKELLKRIAMTDRLTGLYNRQYLEEGIKSALKEAAEKDMHLSFAMIDFDNVKKINDTEGHYVMDQVFVQLGDLFKQFGKENNVMVYRYGGDEFFVILQGKDKEKAYELLDDFRKKIADYSFMIDNNGIAEISRTSFSAGVAEITLKGMVKSAVLTDEPMLKKTTRQVIEDCDKLLYRAKKSRNSVVYL